MVIVNDDLDMAGVPFPRQHYICPCILEHRNEVREYESCGQHILHAGEQYRSLPYPSARILVVVSSVARPECDVSAGEPFCIEGSVISGYKGDGMSSRIGFPVPGVDGVPIVSQFPYDKRGGFLPLTVDFPESVSSVPVGKK